MSNPSSAKKPANPWDADAYEKLLAAVIKNNPHIKLKSDDIAQYLEGYSARAVSHRLTMAKNDAEAMTTKGDTDSRLEQSSNWIDPKKSVRWWVNGPKDGGWFSGHVE